MSFSTFACTALLCGALSIPAFGQPAGGLISGIANDSSTGKPVAEAQIVVRNLAKGTDRAAVTGADGIFNVTNLEPGLYEVAATKSGFQKSSARVEVAGHLTVHVDLPLLAAADPALTEREQKLLDRIERLEIRLAAMEARAAGEKTVAVKTAPVPEVLLASRTPVAFAPPAPAPQAAGQTSVPAGHIIPDALQAPPSVAGVDNFTPFAYGDFTWLNGSARTKDTVLDTKFFTPEVRFDTHFITDFNQPKDHTMGGSTEQFRSGEVQLEQISVGGDFHWQNVRGRILTMFGMFGVTTPRNDGSSGVGQWDVRGAYRYVSEAYGGYHFDVNHGLNVDAGIFVSYIGLFSYYNFDNWAYQPSFVSSNTPWFFNGVRIQWFPTNKLKIEPWIINGWQSYNRFNGHRGFGGQILYRPKEWLSIVSNNYGNGTDTLGNPNRFRLHTDDSIEVRYYNHPEKTGISKMAFSFTADAGCEYGGGVTCHGGAGGPKQSFLGFMGYNRIWFGKDKFAITLGGGKMNNQGRYLTLLPPINGADAVSGSPYFTANPGDKAHMWDANINLQWMPRQYITWWTEFGYRHSDVPYWSGRGGITPPGGNTGAPAQYVCAGGGSAGTNDLATAYVNCGGPGSVWFPDLRKGQATASVGVMVKF
ncbi:MAG: TonB-dependent receptor [Candidatus Solibacter usitatus]|nr:TonB-dependent receptor [Candidatus Solibacter usitatus]